MRCTRGESLVSHRSRRSSRSSRLRRSAGLSPSVAPSAYAHGGTVFACPSSALRLLPSCSLWHKHVLCERGRRSISSFAAIVSWLT